MSELRSIRSTRQRQQLLQLARATARQALGAADPVDLETPLIEGRFGGVFVTFWRKKVLRGCVGTFVPTNDIASSVVAMTRASLRDSRFASNPITAAELDKLDIDLSVLSDPEPTDDPLSLIPGVHGVIVRQGRHTGCFLPKVATERGWSAEKLLSQCCVMKAGLAADAWRSPDTEVKLFQADVLSESERSGDAATRS